jgi:hypothetical protein
MNEMALWEEFKANRRVTITHGRYTDKCTAAFWFSDADFPDEEDISSPDYNFNFFAGYVDEQGRSVEVEYVPEKVFKEIFLGAFPKGVQAEWNGAEATHFIESSIPITVAELKPIIRERLLAHGFVEIA